MHTSTISLYIGRCVLYAIVGLLTLQLALPFAAPLIMATIVASIFLELKKYLPNWLTSRPALYATASILLTVLLIIIPIFVIVILLGMEAFAFVQFLNGLLVSDGYYALSDQLQHIETMLNDALSVTGTSIQFDAIVQNIAGNLEMAGTFLYNNAAHILSNIANLLFNTFFFLFVTFFMVKDGDRLIEGVKRLLPFDKKDTQHLVDSMEHVGQTVVLGSIIASFVLGIIMAALFSLFGFRSSLLWGMCIALLSLVPLVGTWLIYIPSIVFLVLTTSWVKGLLFLICVLFLESFLFYGVIRPKFLDSKTQLYPVAIFIGILGGLTSFGPIGIVYGPLIMAAFITITKHLSLRRRGYS